jgi:hypothetical protein
MGSSDPRVIPHFIEGHGSKITGGRLDIINNVNEPSALQIHSHLAVLVPRRIQAQHHQPECQTSQLLFTHWIKILSSKELFPHLRAK